MFLDFYELREQPFGVTPDPRFLYLSPTHREALASLIYGIETGRGFLALIAKPGMGKTTLLFQLLDRLRSSARTVFLFQTQCDSREFFRYLLTDLGIDTREQDLAGMHEQLNEVLLRETRAGKRFVLVIDEAQNLEDSVLETVRLLSDFETPRAKLLQIILSGQPQLADKLARPALAQLLQRVSILSRLDPFSRAETADYIHHRLRVAGFNGKMLFEPAALAMISARSQGIPRNINNLCFNALSLGYALGRKTIDSDSVQEVVCDLDVDSLVERQHAALDQQHPTHRPVISGHPSPPALFHRPFGVGEMETGVYWAGAAVALFLLAGIFSISFIGRPNGTESNQPFATVTRATAGPVSSNRPAPASEQVPLSTTSTSERKAPGLSAAGRRRDKGRSPRQRVRLPRQPDRLKVELVAEEGEESKVTLRERP